MNRSDLALAALASAAVPGMKPVAVARMSVEEDEGELEQAIVEDATGRRWLVRSPLTVVAGARLQRNDELVRHLSRHLPFKVPAPAGYALVGSEGHAAVYPHVEGMALDLTHLPPGTGLAHAVGRAIAAIHNIPPAVFENQDVPTFDAAGCRQRLIADVDRAAETGRVPTRLLARWEEAFDAAPLWQFATTPVHGAFRGATVLVAFADDDADSGRVVAVTDWEEAMIADPAADLADLCSRAAPGAWASVLDSYALARAQRPDPHLESRARLISETRRLRGLARAVGEADEEAARRVVESLRRMDRLTDDEDSLVPSTAHVPLGGPQGSSAGTVPPDASPGAGPLDGSPSDEGSTDDEPTGDELTGEEPTQDGHAAGGQDPDETTVVELPPLADLDATPVEQDEVEAHEVHRAESEQRGPDAADADPIGPEPSRSDRTEGAEPDGAEQDEVGPGEAESDETGPDEDETGPDENEPHEAEPDEERLHELYGMPTDESDQRP